MIFLLLAISLGPHRHVPKVGQALSRVADPAHFHEDPGPDPTIYFNADPDPAPHQSDLRPLVYRPYGAPFGASKPPVKFGPAWKRKNEDDYPYFAVV